MPTDLCISDYSEKSLLLLLLKAQAGSPTGTHEQVDGSAPASVGSLYTYPEGAIVRLVAINGSAGVVFGAGPADDADVYLAPDVPEYFSINTATEITVYGAVVDITEME